MLGGPAGPAGPGAATCPTSIGCGAGCIIGCCCITCCPGFIICEAINPWSGCWIEPWTAIGGTCAGVTAAGGTDAGGGTGWTV